MASVVAVKKEIERLKQETGLKPRRYLKVWMADCLVVDRGRIIDGRVDEKGRKWSAVRVECRE